MKIRHLKQEDIPAVMEIYAHAREFQKAHGNPNQWAKNNWPPKEVIEADAVSGKGYVCCEDNRICAVFYYDYGRQPEKTYEIIDGRWKDDSWYGVVHRIASDGTVKGAGSFCIMWAFELCGHLRIDTHEDNYVMQNMLEKLGFERCGIIYLDDGDPRLAYEKSDPEGRRIFETEGSDPLRVFAEGSVWQSAVSLKHGISFEPVFPYCRVFTRIFEVHRSVGKMLMIGGGMMTFPAYVLSKYPDITVDVAEPDGRLLPLAEEYFGLKELYDRYHVKEEGRLNVYTQDGRSFLQEHQVKYDVIINDAFSGPLPAASLCSKEAAEIIRGRLNENGLYAVNVPGLASAAESDFLMDEIRTLREVFRYVLLLEPDDHEGHERDNYILFASDVYDYIEDMVPYSLAYTAVITDRDTPHLQDFYESLNG